MSTYEEATKELSRIRRQFRLSPDKSPASHLGKSSLDDSFLSSGFSNRSVDRNLFSASMSALPAQSKRAASPPSATRHSLSQPSLRYGDSFNNSTRKTSFNVPGDSLGASFRSTRSGGPTTSVIEAFRELQSEVKVLEAERFEALREKEEIRNRILEAKRNLSLQRHRHELDATEKDLQIKAQNDRLQRECEDVRVTMIAKEEIYDSLQRKFQAQQHLQQSLQEDIHRCEQKLVSMEKTSTLLRRELKEITGRASNVEHVIVSSPDIHRSKTNRIEDTIESLQEQIDKIHVGKMKSQSRLSSLRSYVDMILKINGELCETLLARESAKREVMRLTRALTPPRYTWPKEVPYHDILHAVNESAKWTAEAAVDRAALKATESALSNVVRAISPSRSRSRSRSRSHSRSGRKVTISEDHILDHSRSYLDDEQREEGEPERRGRSINRSLRFASGPATTNKGKSYLDSSDENSSNDENGEEDEEEQEALVGDRQRLQQYQQSLRELLQEDQVSKKKTGKKLKKKVKKSKKAFSNAATRSVGSADSASLDSNGRRPRGRKVTITSSRSAANEPRDGAEALSRFLSDVRRKRSLQTVIARQAAITHATRLAAAASAASNSVKITSNNNSPPSMKSNDPVSSLHRNTTASLYNRKSMHEKQEPPAAVSNVSKVAFVPSSTTGSNEFNIVASVSRAARATKELNATVASRVKSLHSGGAGELFEEIPRVTLADLQHQLRAVKELRKSFEG